MSRNRSNFTNYSNRYSIETPKDEFVEEIENPEEVEEVEEIKIEVENQESKSDVVKVSVDLLNLRPYPSSDNIPVKVLHKDEELMVMDETGNWCHVITASSAEGYVMKEYVE